MNDNLDQLRQVAANATPGPWAVYDRGIGCEVHDANGCELNGGMRETFTEADATHIATFDPPTVLTLLERVEAAERTLVELKPAEVLVEGSYFPVAELPTVLGNFMRASEEHAREAKAYFLRAEAAEQALDFHTQRDRELKKLLSMIADRLDEFCYDELSSLIEDGPLDQWGETYKSKLQAAEAAVQRVRETHNADGYRYFGRLPGQPLPEPAGEEYCTHCQKSAPCPTVRALDGGEQK